jgi:hypothetical protein
MFAILALPAEEGLAVSKGAADDTAATERFCAEVLRKRAHQNPISC